MFSARSTIVSSSPSVAIILLQIFNLSSNTETMPKPQPEKEKKIILTTWFIRYYIPQLFLIPFQKKSILSTLSQPFTRIALFTSFPYLVCQVSPTFLPHSLSLYAAPLSLSAYNSPSLYFSFFPFSFTFFSSPSLSSISTYCLFLSPHHVISRMI